MTIKWGVLLPTFATSGRLDGAPLVVAAARRAEQLGFDAVWAGDHLLCPAPVLDSLCALSAAAAVTSRVELGVGVLQLGLRQPAWAAKQLATVDALAPGRLRLGVGVGGEFGAEFAAAGADLKTRGARLDEMMAVLPALLRGEPVSHSGPLAPVRAEPGLRPAVSRMPPIAVGGRSDVALRRAARYGDQWLAMWTSPKTLAERARVLAKLAAEYGRPTPGLALLVTASVHDDVTAARQRAAELIARQYDMPFGNVEKWTAYGPAATVAGMLAEYAEAGVTEFVLMPAGDEPDQYDALAEVRELVR
jgi:alkanesulfonate monooxygenase SsuD/methylene tetrahydromethanopterin reductase-like flavin-dependent oxidoreductase (luciferase family)